MPGAYRRGMVFGAFLGACLAVGLIGAALSTDYWIISQAVRTPHGIPHNESSGRIHFGLFHGVKELNVGYGWRTYPFSLRDSVGVGGDELVDYWAWVGVCTALCAAALSAAGGALFSLVNAAASPATAPLVCLPVLDIFTSTTALFLFNSLSIVFELIAAGVWTWQYYKKLQYNVISAKDKELSWTSNGLAFLGYSYWIVIASALVHIINIIFIYSGTNEMRQRKAVKPVLEEKPNGNIMLY